MPVFVKYDLNTGIKTDFDSVSAVAERLRSIEPLYNVEVREMVELSGKYKVVIRINEPEIDSNDLEQLTSNKFHVYCTVLNEAEELNLELE